jgi:hypothetical protein
MLPVLFFYPQRCNKFNRDKKKSVFVLSPCLRAIFEPLIMPIDLFWLWFILPPVEEGKKKLSHCPREKIAQNKLVITPQAIDLDKVLPACEGGRY